MTKIDDSMSRKQLYNIMYDMLRAQDISGVRLLNICKSQLVTETSVGVINDVMKFVIPSVIKNNIPLSIYESSHHDIFELILDNILTSGNLKDNATRHVVLEAMLSSARNEDHIQLVKKWFKDGYVTNSAGKKLEDVEVSLKHKHTIMERIWSSEKIPLSEKEALMEDLKALDKSDWLDNTQKVCEASHPANKSKMWDLYFSKESEMDKWGLRSYQMSFRGFNQCQHRNHLAQFEEDIGFLGIRLLGFFQLQNREDKIARHPCHARFPHQALHDGIRDRRARHVVHHRDRGSRGSRSNPVRNSGAGGRLTERPR